MTMDSTVATRRALQIIGVSEEDIERYLCIDKKLRHGQLTNDEKASDAQAEEDRMPATKPRETEMELLELRLRDLVLEAVSPLKSSLEEIRSSVNSQLEEQRLVLRDHLTAVQNDIGAQLNELRSRLDRRQENPLALQRKSSEQAGNDTSGFHVVDQSGSFSGSTETTFLKEIYKEDGVLIDKSQSTGYRSDVSAAESSPDSAQFDLIADVAWFKEQVEILQEEQRQYRQDLRRQEHQHMLQQNVSVSRSELQEELMINKDEILSSVKALCSFMEVEITSSTRTLHEESKNAVREMLQENQGGTNEVREMLQENQGGTDEASAEPNSDKPSGESGGEVGSQDSTTKHKAQGSKHENRETESKSLERALERLEALSVGQSQRVIDKIRNPSSNNAYVFHLAIPQYHTFLESDKEFYSLPCALDFLYQFIVVRGVATLSTSSDRLSLGLERMVDAQDLGLEPGKDSTFRVNCSIKAPNVIARGDLEFAPVTVCWSDDGIKEKGRKYVALCKPVQCHKTIVKSGFDKFPNECLVIEFKITLEQEQKSLMSYLKL